VLACGRQVGGTRPVLASTLGVLCPRRPAADSLLLAPSPSSRFLCRLPPVGPPALLSARLCFLVALRSSATLPFLVSNLPRPLFVRHPPVLPDPGSSCRGRVRRS